MEADFDKIALWRSDPHRFSLIFNKDDHHLQVEERTWKITRFLHWVGRHTEDVNDRDEYASIRNWLSCNQHRFKIEKDRHRRVLCSLLELDVKGNFTYLIRNSIDNSPTKTLRIERGESVAIAPVGANDQRWMKAARERHSLSVEEQTYNLAEMLSSWNELRPIVKLRTLTCEPAWVARMLRNDTTLRAQQWLEIAREFQRSRIRELATRAFDGFKQACTTCTTEELLEGVTVDVDEYYRQEYVAEFTKRINELSIATLYDALNLTHSHPQLAAFNTTLTRALVRRRNFAARGSLSPDALLRLHQLGACDDLTPAALQKLLYSSFRRTPSSPSVGELLGLTGYAPLPLDLLVRCWNTLAEGDRKRLLTHMSKAEAEPIADRLTPDELLYLDSMTVVVKDNQSFEERIGPWADLGGMFGILKSQSSPFMELHSKQWHLPYVLAETWMDLHAVVVDKAALPDDVGRYCRLIGWLEQWGVDQYSERARGMVQQASEREPQLKRRATNGA